MSRISFSYKVDLVIQLLDATTGGSVDSAGIFFSKNGEPFMINNRGGGNFVAINVGREDFTLGIKASGYEDLDILINYENLDEKLPIQVAFLIPKENIGSGEPVLSLTGTLSGIESIDGVCVNRPYCSISDFDERKRIMTVFRPGGILNMDDLYYGLIKPDFSGFELIEVLKKTDESKVLLKSGLEDSFTVNSPIARVIQGKVEEDRYCFRVRDDATNLNYLIRYKVKGEYHFKLIDFHEQSELSLSLD